MIASAIGRPSMPGAHRRLRIATDRDPDRDRVLERTRVHTDVRQWSPVLSRPRDALGGAQLEQQLELLREELVVVVEVVAEERERLDEGASARHDLGPPSGQQIERCEVLKDPDGVVRADHVDRARQPDRRRTLCRSREHNGRRGDSEVGAVVLADSEDIEPDLVGELDLLDQVAQPLRRRRRPPRLGVGRHLREGVDAEFHAPAVGVRSTSGPSVSVDVLAARESYGATSGSSRVTGSLVEGLGEARRRASPAVTANSSARVSAAVGLIAVASLLARSEQLLE